MMQPTALFIEIGRGRHRRSYAVPSLERTSEMYCAARDASGLGYSKVPQARVVDQQGKLIAKISYNGRIWPANTER